MDKNNFSQKLAELTALAAASENKLQMTQVLDAFAKGTGNTGGNGSCLCQAGEERDPDTDRGGRGGNR